MDERAFKKYLEEQPKREACCGISVLIFAVIVITAAITYIVYSV